MLKVAVAGVLGLGLGAVLRMNLVPAPERVVVEVPRAIVTRAPESCADASLVLNDERHALENEAKALQTSYKMLQIQRDERDGKPVLWTDDVLPYEKQTVFPQLFGEQLQGATLESADCSEYPCIVTIKLEGVDNEPGSSLGHYQDAFDLLSEPPFGELAISSASASPRQTETGTERWVTFAALPEGTDDNVHKRANYRVRRQVKRVRRMWEEAP